MTMGNVDTEIGSQNSMGIIGSQRGKVHVASLKQQRQGGHDYFNGTTAKVKVTGRCDL